MGGVDQLTNGQSQLSMGNCNQICTLNEYLQLSTVLAVYSSKEQEQMPVQNKKSYSLLLQLVPVGASATRLPYTMSNICCYQYTQTVAVASTGPYANNLHLTPHQHHITQFLKA